MYFYWATYCITLSPSLSMLFSCICPYYSPFPLLGQRRIPFDSWYLTDIPVDFLVPCEPLPNISDQIGRPFRFVLFAQFGNSIIKPVFFLLWTLVSMFNPCLREHYFLLLRWCPSSSRSSSPTSSIFYSYILMGALYYLTLTLFQDQNSFSLLISCGAGAARTALI